MPNPPLETQVALYSAFITARSSVFPLSRLSVFVRRRYSKAHRAFSSRSARKIELAPGFVDGDGRAIGEIQGTQGRAHGQSHLFGHMRPSMMSIGSGMSPGSGPNSRMSVGLYSTSV